MYSFNYRLIDPLGIDQENYLKIHNELFKSSSINKDWLIWYHKKIVLTNEKLGKTRTYGLFDKEKLIGIWSVEPKFLRNDDDCIIKVGRCFAVGISAEYRRMGLFVSLSEYAIREEIKLSECEYIIGFPQTGRSVIGGHLKAGWKEIQLNNIYSFNTENLIEKKYRKDINLLTDFNIITKYYNGNNSFVENGSYKNARYLQHPTHQYLTYYYGNSYIVLKNFSTFCHILDINGEEQEINTLIESCKSICKRHGLSEINVWCHEKYKYFKSINECGFKIGAKFGLPITIIAVNIKSSNNFQISNSFNFGMGVEEGY